ncbi:alpha-L-fucosidase 1 isoform X2 [Cucumis sativus]|uniref:alpha-L-fucosidase 1 isoform X2 n=1 Tax=Cucumis sativus TaxID=3659 RepID=UPI0012F50DE1|nr:alpha-L-fucosidase 1 isoform X2 [Cucumis sativus]KAE8647823.1 hypothetical protein Csa_000518 [Cucumis sativus]
MAKIMGHHCSSIFFLTFLHLLHFSSPKLEVSTPPPLPILPLPSFSQLKWQQREVIMFLHFGPNTFTDSEWGTGAESPAIFNPTALNATQWAATAAAAGISLMILTAKHHDGFCLWPSKYTTHSVSRSPWKNGQGDVVEEFVTAATAHGIDVGLYLSPWDRHDRRYSHDLPYNEYYLAQLQELLKRYGNVKEIWFDGAKGQNAPNMSYYFSDWFAMVKELQSSINIFSDAGPDVRWVGNEKGFAGTSCWSTINRTSLAIGAEGITPYLNKGDPRGRDWVPPECDVSIREGLIPQKDAQVLKQFKNTIDRIFTTNLAQNCSIKASSQRGQEFGPQNVIDDDHLWTYWAPKEDVDDHWIEVRSQGNEQLRFNVVRIQEAIGLGQRIGRHEIYLDGKRIVDERESRSIGYKRLYRIKSGVVCGYALKVRFIEFKGVPLISSLGLHLDPFWNPIRLSSVPTN